MSWSEYVVRTCGSDQGRDFEAKTGLDGSTLSRWKSGRGGGVNAEKVAAFARGYRVPVLEAFVEAGFISAEEAGAAPPGKPDLAAITNAELVELVRERLERVGGERGHRSAPIGAPDVVYTDTQGNHTQIEAKVSPARADAGALRQQLQYRLESARDAAERARVQALLDDLDQVEAEAVTDVSTSDTA